jgi:hypothetical protein
MKNVQELLRHVLEPIIAVVRLNEMWVFFEKYNFPESGNI